MDDRASICCTCNNDKPSGCGTQIRDMDVVKGIGVVGCKRYEKNERRAQYYGKRHTPQFIG